MKGVASYSKSSIGFKKKEKLTLSYWAKECGSIKQMEDIKHLFDMIIEEQGGETSVTDSKG